MSIGFIQERRTRRPGGVRTSVPSRRRKQPKRTSEPYNISNARAKSPAPWQHVSSCRQRTLTTQLPTDGGAPASRVVSTCRAILTNPPRRWTRQSRSISTIYRSHPRQNGVDLTAFPLSVWPIRMLCSKTATFVEQGSHERLVSLGWII